MRSNDTPALHGWRHAYSEDELEVYLPLGSTIYDSECLLLSATNRISCAGQVFPSTIPGKAVASNQLLLWWYEQLRQLQIPSQFISGNQVPEQVAGRAVLCYRLNMYPLECQVFGYYTGQAQQIVAETGKLGGEALPSTLRFGDKLPRPICLISPKTSLGRHNENLDSTQLKTLIGTQRLSTIKDYSLRLYQQAAQLAEDRGLQLAQAGFEFGDGLGYGGPSVVAGGHSFCSGSNIFWDLDPQDHDRYLPTAYSLERQPLYDWFDSAGRFGQASWENQVSTGGQSSGQATVKTTADQGPGAGDGAKTGCRTGSAPGLLQPHQEGVSAALPGNAASAATEAFGAAHPASDMAAPAGRDDLTLLANGGLGGSNQAEAAPASCADLKAVAVSGVVSGANSPALGALAIPEAVTDELAMRYQYLYETLSGRTINF